MDYAEILERWAKYTNYNPEQTSFFSDSYEVHQANKRIKMITEIYDETGALGVIQAKTMFKKLLKGISYNAFEYMKNPNIANKEKEIWDMFHRKEVLEMERSYVDSINQLSNKVIGKFLIGEINDEDVLNDLSNATDIVMKTLEKCNKDLFVRGNEILPITRISTHIHLFETLAECLTELENTSDGIYLCYINCNGTADGYFGFFLKSNGNLLSINERNDESYSGEHQRSGNYTRDKKNSLFPYDYIIKHTNFDSKGRAKYHLIDDEDLTFFKLGQKDYFPIMIAMLMINKQYVGKTLDNVDIKYMDSLLPINLEQLNKTGNDLVIIDNSKLLEHHNSIDLSFKLEKVINGDYSEEFNYENKSKDYRETGVFTNDNQLFVDLWSEGFSYDSLKIYETNSILGITDKNSNLENIAPEFVGTKDRIRLQGYYQIRKQLANYIRDKMHTEWVAFGKTSAIKEWYLEHINRNIDKIEELIAEKYLKIENGEGNRNIGWVSTDEYEINIHYVSKKHPKEQGNWVDVILNKRRSEETSEYYCMKTGAMCSMFFTIMPRNWKQLEILCGCEVPKIVKGWKVDGRHGVGNLFTTATDMVSKIGTPFESYESNIYYNTYNEQRTYNGGEQVEFDFKFAIGYSKRGIKQILIKYENKKVI